MALRTACSRLALVPQAAPSISHLTKRCMAMEGLKGYGDREQAQEKVYFAKEEEKTLRKLLSRVKAANTQSMTDSEKAKERSMELQGCESIVQKYKISDADVDALIEWKHHH